MRITVVALLVLSGCSVAERVQKAREDTPKAAVASELEDAKPLTAEDVTALAVPEKLLELLPYGRRTPVARLVEKSWEDGAAGATDRGFVFSVSDDVARFTVHALRREAKALETDALIYMAGPSTAGRSRIAVMTVRPSETDALYLADPPHDAVVLDDLVELLSTWREDAGVALLAIEPHAIELEIEQLPEAADELVWELVELGGHLHPSDGEAAEAFRAALEGRRSVRLGG